MTSLVHPAANPECPHCHGLGLVTARQGPMVQAVPCACVHGPCPACGDTRFVIDADGHAHTCVCQSVVRRQKAVALARLPARYRDADLRACKGFQADKLRTWVGAWKRDQTRAGILFHGNVGAGKTHLVVAAALELILQHGASVRFIEFTHLVADLKKAFERGEGATELLEPLGQVDVLIIDELGKGRMNEFELTLVDELVSRRYNAAMPILATTNFAPDPPTGTLYANLSTPHKAQPTLGDRLGERVYSRLREMCVNVPMATDDLREQNRPSPWGT